MKKIFALIIAVILYFTSIAQSFWACGRDFLNASGSVTAVNTIYNEYYGKGTPGSMIPGFTDVVYALDGGEEDGDETLKGGSCPMHADNCRYTDAMENWQQRIMMVL